VEELVEGKLEGRPHDAKVLGSRGIEPFTVIHGGRESRSGIQESRRAKVAGKESWETETVSRRLSRGIPGLGGGSLSFHSSSWQRPYVVMVSSCTARGAGCPSAFVELGRRREVGLLDRLADGRGRLVDTECELHALDGTRERIVAGLAVALLLDSTPADHVGGVVMFEIWSLKLLDTPAQMG
jgi:hypothetical protein